MDNVTLRDPHSTCKCCNVGGDQILQIGGKYRNWWQFHTWEFLSESFTESLDVSRRVRPCEKQCPSLCEYNSFKIKTYAATVSSYISTYSQLFVQVFLNNSVPFLMILSDLEISLSPLHRKHLYLDEPPFFRNDGI